jgi:hypothetical protein
MHLQCCLAHGAAALTASTAALHALLDWAPPEVMAMSCAAQGAAPAAALPAVPVSAIEHKQGYLIIEDQKWC